jgi:hypothetical protein
MVQPVKFAVPLFGIFPGQTTLQLELLANLSRKYTCNASKMPKQIN